MSRVLRAFTRVSRQPSLEAEVADGAATKEIEYMFYAKADHARALLKAVCVEIQQQWGLWTDKSDKNAGSGSNRVRKTITKQIVDGDIRHETAETSWVMTTKIKTKEGDAFEVPNPSSEAGLQTFRILAESGMIKHRYRFPCGPDKAYFLPGNAEPLLYAGKQLCWEVDMFVVPGESMLSTNYMEWCKIDLEVPSRDTPIPEFPEGFSECFDSKAPDLTDEQKAVIEDMKKFLSLPNAHVTEFYKDVLTS